LAATNACFFATKPKLVLSITSQSLSFGVGAAKVALHAVFVSGSSMRPLRVALLARRGANGFGRAVLFFLPMSG
jgi:hypothetical protein